jgi:hypothetical protein
MSTPYESLAQLAQERVARLTVEARDARRLGAAGELEQLSALEGERPARPLASPATAPLRRLLPIRLP